MDKQQTIAITGWGILSSIGLNREEFQGNLVARISGLKDIPENPQLNIPLKRACVIPEFEAAKFLGVKGTRTMDRTTAMAVYTVGASLEQSRIMEVYDPSRVGVVIGTSTGSIKSSSDFIVETLIHEKPYLVNPALFPNTVMNCAAGNCAIWHKLKGLNSTISGGSLSGLLSIRYASLYLKLGYVDAILTGAVEEFCEQSAWAYHKAVGDRKSELAFGEGCSVFTMETLENAEARGARVLGKILATDVGLQPLEGGRREMGKALARSITNALSKAGVNPEEISVVSMQGASGTLNRIIEEDALSHALGVQAGLKRQSVADLVGDCFSASNVFQLSEIMSLLGQGNRKGSGYGLVTSVSANGQVGCILVQA